MKCISSKVINDLRYPFLNLLCDYLTCTVVIIMLCCLLYYTHMGVLFEHSSTIVLYITDYDAIRENKRVTVSRNVPVH